MIIRDVETQKSKSQEIWDKILSSPISSFPITPDISSIFAGGIVNNVAGGTDVKEHLKNLIDNNMAAYGLTNATPYTFQEPISPIGTTLHPSILKPTLEEQYSKIQEELSNLTKVYNHERKEHAETLKEKDKQIAKLQKENEQVQKKLTRAKTRAKSYKDELNVKNKLVEVSADVDDLQDRMRRAEDVLHIKEEGV